MNDIPHWLIDCAYAVVAVNLVCSIAVIRSQFYSIPQKLGQVAIMWLIPILGSLLVWSFLRSQYNWKMFDTRTYPEHSEKMRAVEIDSALQEASNGHHHSD